MTKQFLISRNNYQEFFAFPGIFTKEKDRAFKFVHYPKYSIAAAMLVNKTKEELKVLEILEENIS